MNKKQTDNANKIQHELNNINARLLGINLKLALKTEQKTHHWYEYIIYSLQNDANGNIVQNRVFSGKPEAVLGYIKGFSDSMYLFNR